MSNRNIKYGKIILHVNNQNKACAIRKLLRYRYDEIGTPLDVEVKDTTGICDATIIDAFSGNPHFSEFINIPNPVNPEDVIHVCIFQKEVIQFHNDNAGSLHGFEFRLMQDLAGEIIDVPALIFTTEDDVPR